MKILIDKILSDNMLLENPPILLDIGASCSLLAQWETIAAYSICIAFDADERDFKVEESKGKPWEKLYSLNRLVAAQPFEGLDFYLTKSPYCSSPLEQYLTALGPWVFNICFKWSAQSSSLL